MRKFFSFCLCCYVAINSNAQVRQIDSLKKLLINIKEDTTKVQVLATLGLYEPSFEGGLQLAREGLSLARKIKYKKGIALCLNQLGNQYLVVSNYPIALRYYLQGLKIREEISDSIGIAVS